MATRAQLKTVEQALDELPNDTLHAAMARAFAEIEAATKGAENPAFKVGGKASKYANLGAVIDAVKPALISYGLFVTQHCHPDHDGVSVETVLHHRSGESLSLGTLYVPANKKDPQGFGSALTYARRYGFQTAFVVPTEDDDGNAAVAAINDRPTTGETPPAKRVKLPDLKEGVPAPYPFLTHLQTATHEFVRTLNSFADLEEFTDWGKTDEVQLYLKQLRRDLPGWWGGGNGAPDDWVPIEILIAQRKRDLEQIAGLKEPA